MASHTSRSMIGVHFMIQIVLLSSHNFVTLQSIMQLFMLEWAVISDLCSTVDNYTLLSFVHGLTVRFDGLSLLFVIIEHCSKCSPYFENLGVITAQLRVGYNIAYHCTT